ncbi:hypothetical protein SEMRO_2491_G329150.1 [Seminavis robusta]|uniref:Uncharacterized protein n=1 Tax=Seminavis robusta TaxID=568900 RepID=A0A9N8HXK2_9STRA|nr:hypothetical protein SEMRO_2491_G329150.1 [Seminavis robusta]|eukprot:Sro2491_g329150.1 n/a (106) ;mRNA; f:6286-6603
MAEPSHARLGVDSITRPNQRLVFAGMPVIVPWPFGAPFPLDLDFLADAFEVPDAVPPLQRLWLDTVHYNFLYNEGFSVTVEGGPLFHVPFIEEDFTAANPPWFLM